MVAVREKGIPQRFEYATLVGAEMVGEDQVKSGACLGFVAIVPMRIVPASTIRDLLRGETEQEEVLLASFLRHFDGGAVAGADSQSSVNHEFHVAGAAGFIASRRDLIRDVAGRDQALCQRNAVIRDEQHLDSTPNFGAVVDGIGQIVNELDDELRQAVAGSRFPRKKESTRPYLCVGILQQSIVEHHDAKRVQELAFVFVNTFDLAVED